MVALFAGTLGLSALLLFWAQPMFARMALPLLGGAPAVWNTAMAFFQATLLAGYAYAHLSTRLLPPRGQALLHLALLAAAALLLPIAPPEGWRPPAEATPIPWLLGLLAVGVGAPFLVASATAPLLQAWFARTRHRDAGDPYFLYAASNLGSLVALIGYPFLLEPLLGLEAQAWAWTAGYVALAVLIALCAFVARRSTSAAPAPLAAQVAWRTRARWVALAFVPSSLLLGVTQHITTDLAAVPLFWVAPLALYLLTFVIAFARRPAIPHWLALKLQIFLLLPVALTFHWQIKALWLVFALHLGAFFFTTLVCHGELAKSRPPAARLTEFYLWMSLGGVLGGAFNAFAAPLLFGSILEYPLMLALAGLLRPTLAEGPRSRLWDLALPAVLGLALIPKAHVADGGLPAIVLYTTAIGLLAYSFGDRPLRFALGVALMLTAGVGETLGGRDALHQARSFFGVHRVLADDDAGVRVLLHGTTIHGAQAANEARRREPLAYYHREGPLGQAFEALGARVKRVGAVGLGAGASACHRRDGQQWRFFDIDPLVERIARDPRFFDYLARCAPDTPVLLGDARLTLADEPEGAFHLLLLDAFSSDAIPLHLLTREALALYVRKLAPGGVLLLHISNWHLDLEPVAARLAADAGLAGRVQHFRFSEEVQERSAYRFSTSWVALARSEADLGRLAQDERWAALVPPAGQALWTDDYANLVGALRWTRN